MQSSQDTTAATQGEVPAWDAASNAEAHATSDAVSDVVSDAGSPLAGYRRRHRGSEGYGEILDELMEDLDDH